MRKLALLVFPLALPFVLAACSSQEPAPADSAEDFASRVGAPKDVAQALAAPLGRLSIAGEATSPQFFGTLHGAVESGQRAAAEVLGSS